MYRLKTPIQIVSVDPPPLLDGFCSRLIEFYNRQPYFQPFSSMIWNTIAVQYHKDFITALVARDIATVKQMLLNLGDGGVMYGFDTCRGLPIVLNETIVTDMFLDALTALEILPVLNPEQPTDIEIDAGEYLRRLEDALGFNLDDKKQPGKTECFRIDGRNIRWSVIKLLCDYAAIRMLDIFPVRNVVEIGAGSGAMQWFLGRTASYHTVDIPLISVIQAYMISCSAGEEGMWLSGEPKTTKQVVHIHGLKHEELAGGWYDLVYNRNSIPEIPESISRKYLDAIIPEIRPGGIFFSVNHESSINEQTSVASIMKNRCAMRKERRCLAWSRRGYVEEVWRKIQ